MFKIIITILVNGHVSTWYFDKYDCIYPCTYDEGNTNYSIINILNRYDMLD